MFGFFKTTKRQLIENTKQGVFFYQLGKNKVTADPLDAYVRIKRVGLDVMFEDVQGALRGDEKKLEVLANNICEAFQVTKYDPKTGKGWPVLHLIRLYLAYYRFLDALKKNVTLLHVFAPVLEGPAKKIYSQNERDFVLPEANFSSDSTSTQSTLSPTPDLPPSSEQAEPSTE